MLLHQSLGILGEQRERWEPALLATCDAVFATLLTGLRRSPSWLIGHKEWAPGRKIDPHPLSMDDRRRGVRYQGCGRGDGAGIRTRALRWTES